MDLISASFRFPLRFSSIFWTQNEVNLDAFRSFTCFRSHIILGNQTLEGVSLIVAGKHGKTGLASNHAYRIEGDVAAGGFQTKSTIFEDNENTITIDHAEVRLNCIHNKVSAQGVGQIVDWCLRTLPNTGHSVEVIKVKHRCSNPDIRVEFYANYVVDTDVSSTLHLDALSVGNIISLRGNVVGHDNDSGTWEIHTAEIQMIHYQPVLRRSKRQRGFPPS